MARAWKIQIASLLEGLKPYLEVVGVYAIFVLYDLFYRDGAGFADFRLHPFWLPLLIFSTYYGTFLGLWSVVCSVIALYAYNFPVQLVDEDLYAYWYRIGELPILWLILSVVLGEIAIRQRLALRRAEEQLRESLSREDLLCEAFTELEYVKQTREREIAALTSSSVQILNVISGVSLRDPSAIMERVLELVSLALQPSKFSLYVLKEENLSLALAKGWTADDKFGTRFAKGSSLFQSVVAAAEVITILDTDGAKNLGSEGVMAAPLIDMRSKQVLGMIKLEDLDWSHVTSQNITLLRLIGEWSGSMYMFAQEFHVKRAKPSKWGEFLSNRSPVKELGSTVFPSESLYVESQ